MNLAWGAPIVLVLIVLSWGWRARERLDLDHTERSIRALSIPAQKDAKRAGGVVSGLIFFSFVMLHEFTAITGDIAGHLGDFIFAYPDALGFAGITSLGFAGITGALPISGNQFLGLVLVLAAFVLMLKN